MLEEKRVGCIKEHTMRMKKIQNEKEKHFTHNQNTDKLIQFTYSQYKQ